MTKNRLIFFSIFGAFHLISLIFTLMIGTDFNVLLKIFPYISWFKYGTLFGLLLLFGDVLWSWKISKETIIREEEIRHENNVLKAKVYDFQEAAKGKSATQAPK